MTGAPSPAAEKAGPTIRPAHPEDAPACAAILQDWLDATSWMPDLHTFAETEAFVSGRLMARTVLAAGDVAGFPALDEERGEVSAFYIREDGRGGASARPSSSPRRRGRLGSRSGRSGPTPARGGSTPGTVSWRGA